MNQTTKSHSKDESEREAQLTQENLGLVVSQAMRFHPTNVTDLEDYIQVGGVGLLKAIRTYDPERGKWSTYAGTCIAREIAKEARRFSKGLLSIDEEYAPEVEDTSKSSELKELFPATLTEQEQEVLALRVQNHTLKEIGEICGGYSKQWSKNVLESAFQKIRAATE